MPNWKALDTLPRFVPRRITPLGKPILRLTLAGTHLEIGRQRGRELAEDLRGMWDWMEYYLLHVMEFPTHRWEATSALLERNLVRHAPWMLEEIHGMAEGSGLPAGHLMLGCFYSLLGDAVDQGCTSVAVRKSDEGPLLGQNLDIGPEDFHYVEKCHAADEPALLRHGKLTTCHNECGMNEAGLAVASSNLPAPAQRRTPWSWEGIYFHFLPSLVMRRCSNVKEAVEYLRSLPPTIPSSAGYQLNLLDASGAMAVVDKTGHHTIVRQCDPDLNFTSNCTPDDAFERWRLGEPGYPDGQARVRRIREEWRSLDGAVPTRQWLEGLMRTDAGDGCLCRWSPVGYSRLSFIFSPWKKTMDISNGPPNRTGYETVALQEDCA